VVRSKLLHSLLKLAFLTSTFLVGQALAEESRQQSSRLQSSGAVRSEGKKITKYRKYTEVDLTGATVNGSARAPEVFYIFQRKRSDRLSFVKAPKDLTYQHSVTKDRLERVFGN